MPELKRSFQSGRMNKSLDERLVPNGEYRDALNIEIATSESDDLGSAQTTMGNKLIGSDLPNPSSTLVEDGAWPHLQGNWNEVYRNKTVGSIVDEKNDWGYRLIAGPPPQEPKGGVDPTEVPPAFEFQTNLISADYIVRNNNTIEEPVLVDIYSVAVGRFWPSSGGGWPVPTSPTDVVIVPDVRGLREGMELNIYVVDGLDNVVNQADIAQSTNKKAPKITSISLIGVGQYSITLSGKIDFSTTLPNNLVFSAPRVLNFEHDHLITGINIIDDFLFWTDNHTEPKKIHIPKSVLGCKHPFTSTGTNPLSFYHHTNFVTKLPSAINSTFDFWLGDEDDAGIPGGRPVEEKHITVIKESPHLTPVLEMVKAEGDVNTDGTVLDNDPLGTGAPNPGPFNPFMDDITQDSINDEVWISYGGPSSITPLPCVGCSTCPPPWNSTCHPDWSVIPFYEAGDIVVFTVPGTSPALQIRAEILLGPDWNYGSYKVRIISSSGDIDNYSIGWISELESTGAMFQYKFPRFATRYKYEDGEYSTYSPFTEVAFLPDRNPMDYLPKKGYNLNMTNNLKSLAIKGFVPHNELLPDDVESIEIVYKESDSSNVYSVTKVERNSDKWNALSNTVQLAAYPQWKKTKGYVKIKSEMIQGTIAPNQLLRHWDAVPRKALAQEMTGNRLLYGNYLQNYNLSALDEVNCGTGSNIFGGCEPVEEVETDLMFKISSLTDVGELQPEEENVEDAWNYGPAKSIKTLRTYQLGINYRDKYGRETPVFSSIDMTKYHEKDSADKASHFAAAIKNIVPDFAESFKFFVKETANEYYNLPMDRWYDAEDGNIWLSFPSSERSKISINSDEERFEDTFIILKKEHGNDNFVSDPARYKVLAIENDAPRFIKTVKSPVGVLSGLGSGANPIFTAAGFPIPLNDFIRIPSTEFENIGWQDTLIGSNMMNDLKIRIGTDVIKSQWYTITSVFAVTGTSEYEIKVDRDFKGDMVFATTDTLNIEVVEEEVKYLPEFDGRFFVKIHKDPTLEKTILSPSGNSTDSYQVISSMLCQVIDPNSDWSTAAPAPDAWDGWGTQNTQSTSNVLPAVNYQDGVNAPIVLASSGGTFSQAASTPITGPDWAISSNHTGAGEQYWQGFEAQDATFGGGNASRWFIDKRSGTNQMFQTYRSMRGEAANLIGGRMRQADFEIQNSGNVMGGLGILGGLFSKPDVNNAVVPSIPNNPGAFGQNNANRTDINTLGGMITGMAGWSETEPGAPVTGANRFKSPSEGIYTDPITNDLTMIDLSCMGFGGPELVSTLGTWISNLPIPYSRGSTAGCNRNCNSAWLSDNGAQYTSDVVFISAITTPGTTWRWAEDPDQTLYETQNSNTQISDWFSDGGTLGGWKRVGESSIHFNTQTIGMTTHVPTVFGWPFFRTHFNRQNTFYAGGVVYQTLANGNQPLSLMPNPPDDLWGESSSNTANWNRSQRWTIEARTLSGDELGSGPSGYLPTNDPRWIKGDTDTPSPGANPSGAAPGVRHDGMGSGESSSSGTTSTNSSNLVRPPSDYDAAAGITSGSFTWQVLLPESSLTVFNSTGSFSTSNPAIWETEPKKSVDLDIYYEIGQIYATRLNERTGPLHAPVGSEVKIYRPANSAYVQMTTPTPPTGWIPWSAGPMFVESWNELPAAMTTTGIDKTFPNEIRIVDSNGIPDPNLTHHSTPYPGDILVFYRADGSTTEAEIVDDFLNPYVGSLMGWYNYRKGFGVFSMYESIANRYIRPPWFNCYSFGNGVESNRIRDDFNEVIIDKGPKASSTTSKTYKEERRGSGMIFSGIFNSKTGVNNLNQFIEAESITKDLNPTYGSIQKLHSRDTDLVTLCEEKCLRVLANKDALYNADGNINMIAVPNVLGQAVAYAGGFGISKNPESFASASFRSYFTDKNKGVVLRLSQDGLTPISNVGMKDWFTDNLPGTYEVIGSFDERKGDYNVTLSDHSLDTTDGGDKILALGGNTLTFNENIKGWSSFKSFLQEQGFSLNNNYYTAKHGNIWKHHDSTVNRNTFYNNYTESSITLLFNESPGSVKSFNTLNYEGTQSKITRDISKIGTPSSLQPGGATYTDFEHYDNWAKNGWYVNKMTTNLQETNNLEFKDKEGKWFAQIKGDTTTLDNIDPREFSYQGIDEISIDPSVQACIYGCMDPNALNYDPSATCDDGSCTLCGTAIGCTDPAACNYNSAILAACDDGSCCYTPGCMSSIATNYNPLACCDDGSCILPTPCTPANNPSPYIVPVDTYGRIETACGNTGPGSGTTNPSQLSFYVDTDGGNNTLTYDYTIVDSGGNTISTNTGQTPGSGNTITITPINPPPAVGPIGSTDYYITVTDSLGCSITGQLLTTISSDYMTYGCTDPAATNTGVPMPDCDDGSCITNTAVYGCMESAAFNYDPLANTACDGSLNISNPGCTSTSVPPCAGPGSGQGDCCTSVVAGCTDNGSTPDLVTNGPYATTQAWWVGWGYDTATGIANYPGVQASTYNATANTENGSCTYDTGCTDGNATNWGGTSITVDDGSCVYCSNSSGSNYYTGATVDCNGDPIGTWGLNWDSCCTGLTPGCLDDGITTNSTYVAQRPSSWVGQASNYCGTCNVHSATCVYEGCTDASALNETPGAITDDGSCQYCSDPSANNYWGANAPNDCAGVSGGTDTSCCTYNWECNAQSQNNGSQWSSGFYTNYYGGGGPPDSCYNKDWAHDLGCGTITGIAIGFSGSSTSGKWNCLFTGNSTNENRDFDSTVVRWHSPNSPYNQAFNAAQFFGPTTCCAIDPAFDPGGWYMAGTYTSSSVNRTGFGYLLGGMKFDYVDGNGTTQTIMKNNMYEIIEELINVGGFTTVAHNMNTQQIETAVHTDGGLPGNMQWSNYYNANIYIGTGGFYVDSGGCCQCSGGWNSCGCVNTGGTYPDLPSCETGCGC